jgi:hypothetical protein
MQHVFILIRALKNLHPVYPGGVAAGRGAALNFPASALCSDS